MRYIYLYIYREREVERVHTICPPLGSNSLVLELIQQALVKIKVVAILLSLNWSRVHFPDPDLD